ncbi:MAG: multidrug effflux MFS transporter [Parachlamydiaceae bacterium]|nr:multidrug effflux MFS transporter [Parachlamydiaceae bacterium]
MKNYKIFQLVLILTPFVFSFAFGLDIYIPIVPQMTKIFNTTPVLIQLTLSLFLFFTGVGQLFIGPLSDQYGRKRVFYTSAACYAFGSIGCVFSPSILWLILARVICSLGACGMLVTSFALVRDLYSSDKSAKIYSFLNGAIGISPTFAPIIGGYLAFFFGWQSLFLFLSFIGFFSLLITWKFIEETHEPINRVKINQDVFKRYWKIFTNRQFIVYSMIAGFAEGVFFCFFSISPFIIIDLHGIPTHEFGYYFAVFGSVIGLGGFLSGKIIEKFGIQKTIAIGIFLMLFGGVSMLGWYYLFSLSLQGFLIPMAIACTGAMFLVGGSASIALEPFGIIAGTASAAFGAVEFGIASVVGSMLMLFPRTSTVPYGMFIVILAVFSWILFINEKEKILSSNQRLAVE